MILATISRQNLIAHAFWLFNIFIEEKYTVSNFPWKKIVMNSLRNWKLLRFFSKRSQRNTTSNQEFLRRDIETDVHLRAAEDLLQSLRTDAAHGLPTSAARDLLNKNGFNALTPPRKTSNLLKFLGRCFGGFSLLIWVHNTSISDVHAV